MPAPAAERVAAVRSFNRFYTRAIGVLAEGHLGSAFSLAELRVLYEIARRDRPTASEIAAELGLDRGYLSRILRRFERDGLVTRSPSADDARRAHLALSRRGRARFSSLEAKSRAAVGRLLRPLSVHDQERVAAAMRAIQAALGAAERRPAEDVVLRAPEPGDLGWVVERHGALYAAEYGWNVEFEGMVAGIVADFVRRFDPARERCWIADRAGERLGSVFLVKESARVARLRMLFVEPAARGLGLGARLVDACTAFARAAGYRKIVLWTNRSLTAARRIYERAGYRLTLERRHHDWGMDQVSETWELELGTAPDAGPRPTARTSKRRPARPE